MGRDLGLLTIYGPRLLLGIGLTAAICFTGTCAALLWGLMLALIRRQSRLGGGLVVAYVSVFRGTPFLIQLFLVYYGGPMLGLVMSAIPTGILGLTLYGGAYFSEIFRAGFLSVPKSQREAAQSLGLGRWLAFRFVELPQLLVLVVPPATNEAIILLKESAVLSIITVPELTFQTTRMASETFTVVEPYLSLALLYWTTATLLSRAGQSVEYTLFRHLRPERS